MTDKQPHGGAGRGQGRKPLNEKALTISLSITLTKDDLAFLETIDKNRSAAIRTLIAAARKG